MFHDDDHDDFSSDPTSQGLLLPCPICKREVLCDLRVGRPPALLIATHPDSREALLEQPRCAGSHTILALLPVVVLQRHAALDDQRSEETRYYWRGYRACAEALMLILGVPRG